MANGRIDSYRAEFGRGVIAHTGSRVPQVSSAGEDDTWDTINTRRDRQLCHYQTCRTLQDINSMRIYGQLFLRIGAPATTVSMHGIVLRYS
jgi:hypothetical protein